MKTRQILFILGFGLLVASNSAAQDCLGFYHKAEKLFLDGNLPAAFHDLQIVEKCEGKDNTLSQKRQALQQKIFDAMEAQQRALQEKTKELGKALKDKEKANAKTTSALDSLQDAQNRLFSINADKVRLLLADARRDFRDELFDAAVDKLKSAVYLPNLGNLEDSIRIEMAAFSRSLLAMEEEHLRQGLFQQAYQKWKVIDRLDAPVETVAGLALLRKSLEEAVRADLDHFRHEAAYEKIRLLCGLDLPAAVPTPYFVETIFCLAETGRAAQAMLAYDSLARWNSDFPSLNAMENSRIKDTISLVRGALRENGRGLYDAMLLRYLPAPSVPIPAGELEPGPEAGPDEPAAEKCRAIIHPFYLAPTEVAFYAYDLFCEATGRPKPSDNGWGRAARPAINVSFYDAAAYCNWRSRRDGYQPAYTITKIAGNYQANDSLEVSIDWQAPGYRLPKASEWAYAGGNGTQRSLYSWGGNHPAPTAGGNVADEMLAARYPDWEVFKNYSDGYLYTAPAGLFAPNALGLFDMSGNVWEWCWNDSCGETKAGQSKSKKPVAAVCGGAWSSPPEDCAVNRRLARNSSDRSASIGFRIAKGAQGTGSQHATIAATTTPRQITTQATQGRQYAATAARDDAPPPKPGRKDSHKAPAPQNNAPTAYATAPLPAYVVLQAHAIDARSGEPVGSVYLDLYRLAPDGSKTLARTGRFPLGQFSVGLEAGATYELRLAADGYQELKQSINTAGQSGGNTLDMIFKMNP